MGKRDFSTAQSAKVLGLHPRGLDAIVRRGVFIPTVAEGRRWRWSEEDVFVLFIAIKWRRAGLQWVPTIQRLVGYLKRQGLDRMSDSQQDAVRVQLRGVFVWTSSLNLPRNQP